MTKKDLMKRKITNYFDNHGIYYRYLNESGIPVDMLKIDTIHIGPVCANVLGNHIETMLRFRENHLYVMSYYSQKITTGGKAGISQICELINYINATVSYDTPYDQKLILDDTSDIATCTLIRYESLDVDFYGTINYLLNFQAQFLEDICVPLVWLMHNGSSVGRMKSYIDHIIMKKPRPQKLRSLREFLPAEAQQKDKGPLGD